MKILMLCSTYPAPGARRCGIGLYTKRLVKELCRKGCKVEVLTQRLASSDESATDEGQQALAIIDVWTLTSARRILEYARRQEFDLVHWQYHPRTYGQGWGFLLLGVLSLFPPSLPVILTVHTIRDAQRDSFLRTLLARLGCRFVFFTNRADSLRWTRRLLLSRTSRAVCPVGPTLEPCEDEGDRRLPALSALPKGSLLLTTFGFINRGKGLPTLLTAFSLAREKLPHLHLIVSGEVREEAQSYFEELQSKAMELGLQESIHWVLNPSSQEASQLLAATHLHILPYVDGASTRRTTLISAIAHGVPILTTSPSSPDEPFRQGVNMEWVAKEDAAGLADRIVELAESPERREDLAVGSKDLSQQFTWDRIARLTRRAYAHILGEDPQDIEYSGDSGELLA